MFIYKLSGCGFESRCSLKRSGKEAAKKIVKKYDKLRREKKFQKHTDVLEKRKKEKNIEIIEQIKDSAAKKSARLAAKNVLKKYKKMNAMKKRSPKTFLVDEADLETTDYQGDLKEDLFVNESVLAAANKVFDFNGYKKKQAEAINEIKQQQVKDKPFVNESVLAAANKLFDFDKLKKQQADAIDKFNEQLLTDSETTNYVMT